MATLILLRHGQSTWNAENLFTGWVDVDLTELGVEEARRGGRSLLEAGVLPTIAHTSVLVRAIRTNVLTLEECERSWIQVRRSWRLNERHYGALQGLNKAQTAERHGEDQVHLWRRSYDVPPPPIEPGSRWDQSNDPRYAMITPEIVPRSECLADVVDRMLPYWYDALVPDLRNGHTVLVSAHGNSLRALVKHLEHISDEDIPALNIPTGVPRVYDLDDDLKVRSAEYLGDPDEVAAAAAAVAKQAAGG
ncbi:MAG TPA: phosphoglyceromutase [Euzebyales bacterium]|nr:phosphoglyceromutase [Euzebyales bacterium]